MERHFLVDFGLKQREGYRVIRKLTITMHFQKKKRIFVNDQKRAKNVVSCKNG